MKTVPIVVQLASGIDDKTSDINAIKPGISFSENTDFLRVGEVQGRPSFKSRNLFGVRSLTTNPLAVADGTSVEMANVPYNFTSMFRYRDALGEHPGISANGRVWTWENTRWTDRLYNGTARFERVIDFNVDPGNPVVDSNGKWGMAIGYNYVPADSSTFGPGSPMLSDANANGIGGPNIMGYLGGTGFLLGTSCSAKQLSGSNMYHCCVGNNGSDNNLTLKVRKNQDMTINTYTLKTDCATVTTGINNRGDHLRPQCCTDENADFTFFTPYIWVAYIRTTANSIGVLRVDPTTGTVANTQNYAFTGATGFAIASDSFTNTLSMAIITGVAGSGVFCRKFTASTCVNVPAGDATINTTVGTPGNPVQVSIGLHDLVSSKFCVCWVDNRVANTIKCAVVGVYDAANVATWTLKTFNSDDDKSGWAFAHNPVLLSGPQFPGSFFQNRRNIVGIYYTHNIVPPASGNYFTHTYFALDFTDVNKETANETRNFGTVQPGILAMGTVDSGFTATLNNSSVVGSAIPAFDLASFRFGGMEFKQFSAAGPFDLATGLNQVVLTYPKSAFIGEETILSGSVPRSICRGYAFERVFTQEAPEISLSSIAGASGLATGSYTFQAVWRWTDAAGVIHRSAPSQVPQTISADNAHFIRVKVTNLILHNRDVGKIYIELYQTPVNPTATSQKFLAQQGFVVQSATASTTIDISGQADPTHLALYTNNGAVLQNLPVPADGGVATVNRRMFFSDGKFVYASKLYDGTNNVAVAWNDEGNLTLRVPTPAGRILSLEALDDKLLIFCEHGVFMTQGEGPDDTGLGNNFLTPVQISELGISWERATVSTVHGVVFYSENSTEALIPGYGGLYLIDRGLNVKPIGQGIQNQIVSTSVSANFPNDGSTVPVPKVHLSYLNERDLLLVNTFQWNSNLGSSGIAPFGGFFFVLDMQTGNGPGDWSVWTSPNGSVQDNIKGGAPLDVVGASGRIWGIFSDLGSDFGLPAVGSFDGVPGTDGPINTLATPSPVRMRIRTNHIFANNNDALGWALVRSVTPVGNVLHGATEYTQTIGVTLDGSGTMSNSTAIVDTNPGNEAFTSDGRPKWPVPRDAAEFRLPTKKCSQIQITLEAVPAVPRWSSVRLDVIPSKVKAPTNQRR